MPVARAAHRAMSMIGLMLLAALAPLAPAWAASRLALVIGNGEYSEVTSLANPLNDASAMARRLEQIGFEVTLAANLDRTRMFRAISDLRRRAQREQAEVVALFYAGHGVQVGNTAYLLPVDLTIPETAFELNQVALKVPDVLDELQNAAANTLVFIDACREDPFKQAVTRSLQRSTNFAPESIEPPTGGMLVAYSTGNGELAADGEGRNSPFTAALIEHIDTPGVSVTDMLGIVQDAMEKQRTEQYPVIVNRLRGRLVLVEAKPEPPPAEAPDVLFQVPDELTMWLGIKDSTEPFDFEFFLATYPDGRFAPLARARLERLRAQQLPPPGMPPVANALVESRQERHVAATPPIVPRAAPAEPAPAAPQPAGATPAPEAENATQASEPRVEPEPEPQVAALPDPRREEAVPALVAPAPPPPEPTPPPAAPPAVLTPAPTPPADDDGLQPGPPPAERMWTKGKVNLRASPSRNGSLLGSLAPSTELTVLASRGGWLEVQAADGQQGYVFGELVTAQEPALAAVAPEVPAPAAVKGGRKVGEVFRDCPECPELVAVPPQSGTIGSPASEPGRYPDEGAPQTAKIDKPLAVGRYEVTFAEWDACVAAGGCGKYRPSDKSWGRGNRPVINVSYDDAEAYVTWLSRKTGKSYRLLREAEWELLARAGSSGPNPWNDDERRACSFANGHDETSRRVNALGMLPFACDDGFATTAPVGSFAPNSLGLFDMLGNVTEWTADCYGPAPMVGGSPPKSCAERVVRGGSWGAPLDDMRYARRVGVPTKSRTSADGFRVARGLPEGLLDRAGAPLVAGGG